MAGYEYVSPEQLAGFDKYKYSALDTNPLSLYIMHPFWNTIVKVFPTWLAPNLITFSGFLLVVFNFLLLTYFDPDFYASAPGHKHVPDWVWIVVGILNFVAYTLGCALCVTLPMSLLNFFRSYKSNTLKHNSIYEAMVPFFSPCLLFTLSTVWILRSPSDILEIHPRIFYFMVGTAFANITCQLIVCQMSSTRCPTLNWLLLPLFLVVAAVTIGAAASHLESLLLYALTAAFTLAHIHYGVQVVKQLSSHFQIYPFSLRKPNSD